MNDKQSILGIILISIIFFIWVYYNSPQPQKQQQVPQKALDSMAAAVKTAEAKKAAQPVEPVQDTSGSAANYPQMIEQEQIITVDNSVARFELTNKGGKIKKAFLKHYNNWFVPTNQKGEGSTNEWVELLNTQKGSSVDIEFITNDGKKISSKALKFAPSTKDYHITVKDSATVAYTFTSRDGRQIKKSFTFFNDKYDTRFDLDLTGFNDFISGNSLDVTWEGGIRFVEANSTDEANAANASVFYGGEQVKVDAPANGEKVSQDFNGRVDWVCARNKYFATILAPANPAAFEGVYVRGYAQRYQDDGIKEFYSLRYKMLVKQAQEHASILIYLGPVSYDVLRNYNHHFTSIVDFGSFFGLKFIVRPIAEYVFLPLFNLLNTFIPNYGIIIIIFAFFIKLILHPLNKSSLVSMQKMQLLQPKIAEIKEKYKDDMDSQNKETMKLYQTYGINPVGGCLPLLVQMPVLIALWGLLQSAVELRQQPFIWWITDLSRPDIILHLPFRIPFFGVNQISALATLMGIATFIQQKMTMKDPNQKAMVYIMPVMFTIIFMNFPAGLNLYYFIFNLLSIAQQYYITHHTKGVALEPVKKSSKKGGFMERIMAAAEEKQRQQQKTKKK
ncbi:MAG: membrane protein insertase YidC [Ignavibacteria bacterium]|nr:membrane protein insertase YidC [Ignavibacteria bacterium]